MGLNFNPSPAPREKRVAAFTILELLVVIGILILLMGIIVPALSAAKRHAKNVAGNAQLGMLQNALSKYFDDFQMYPTSATPAYPTVNATFAVSPYQVSGINYIIAPGRGSAKLAEALTGYLPYRSDTSVPVTTPDGDGAGDRNPAATSVQDPALGFRDRTGGLGRIYSYLPTDPKSYKINTDSTAVGQLGLDQAFIDPWGNEILYYHPTGFASPTRVFETALNAATTPPYFIVDDNNNSYPPQSPARFLNQDLTVNSGPAISGTAKFYQLLGVTSNVLSSTNTPMSLLGRDSFLLISAGPNGIYFDDDELVSSKR